MTLARNVACLLAGAAVLAACSKPGAGPAAQAGGPAGAVGGGQAAATSDSELPEMKPGLWEIRMSHVGEGGTHAGTVQQCMGADTMAAAKKTAADYAKANCSKNETHGGGGRWVSDMECTLAAHKMVTHSVTTMTGDGAYHTDLTTTYDPPMPGGGATNTTTVDGKWLSECKPT